MTASTRISVSIPKPVLAALKAEAARLGVSVSERARHYLIESVKIVDPKPLSPAAQTRRTALLRKLDRAFNRKNEAVGTTTADGQYVHLTWAQAIEQAYYEIDIGLRDPDAGRAYILELLDVRDARYAQENEPVPEIHVNRWSSIGATSADMWRLMDGV